MTKNWDGRLNEIQEGMGDEKAVDDNGEQKELKEVGEKNDEKLDWQRKKGKHKVIPKADGDGRDDRT